MIGDLLLFKHKGLYDLGIEWLTRSEYTHVATDIGDGQLIESYPGIGVRQRAIPDDPEMFRFRVKDSKPEVYQAHLPWLVAQIGKSYDIPGILGVALNEPRLHSASKWFCSTLADVFQNICGYVLTNQDPRLTAPGDLANSPLVYMVEKE